jgi:hypothetical protein
VAAQQGAGAEEDEVRGAAQLDHVEQQYGPLDHRADAEGDGAGQYEGADLVADDGGQRGAPAVRQGAADHEQHARAGDEDDERGGERERQRVRG